MKISKECENMGPALPSGATHSRFSEGKEYRGAADPEKARCHLNEKRMHFGVGLVSYDTTTVRNSMF